MKKVLPGAEKDLLELRTESLNISDDIVKRIVEVIALKNDISIFEKIEYIKLRSFKKGGNMAKGKKCPQCGYQMYALEEKEEPMGYWIIYECRNGNCKFKEKVFESK